MLLGLPLNPPFLTLVSMHVLHWQRNFLQLTLYPPKEVSLQLYMCIHEEKNDVRKYDLHRLMLLATQNVSGWMRY